MASDPETCPSQEDVGANPLAEGPASTIVAESLLSMSKDNRYVSHIQFLLEQALQPFVSRSFVPSLLNKTSWYISQILYLMIVVGGKGKTLGMEATGLTFAGKKDRSQKFRTIGSLLGLATTMLLLQLWATAPEREEEAETEGLRGTDRRLRHEAMRQQMLRRANHGASSQQEGHQGESSQPSTASGRFVERLRQTIKTIQKAAWDSMVVDVPHTVRDPSTANVSTRTLLSWILKLHLAQYVVTGQFPTIVHRLLGIKYTRGTEGHGSILAPPSMNQGLAMMILVQGSAVFTRWIIRRWTEGVARYLERPPRVNKKGDQTNSSLSAAQRPSQSTCAICQGPRTHTVVSSECGHVFCWTCLSQWVSTVKDACPYCRAPCRVEDMRPLYHYDSPAQVDDAQNA